MISSKNIFLSIINAAYHYPKIFILLNGFYSLAVEVKSVVHVFSKDQCTMYNELGIIKFVNINKYLIGRFMFRVYHGQVPEFFSHFFVRNCDIHQHETRLAGHFHIPPVKLDLSKTGIKYKGAIIWNNILQEDVNLDVSEAVFKKYWSRCWILCQLV